MVVLQYVVLCYVVYPVNSTSIVEHIRVVDCFVDLSGSSELGRQGPNLGMNNQLQAPSTAVNPSSK